MVDVGGRPQPELGAALARGVHDAEVVLPRPEEGPLLLTAQLSNHSKQVGDPLAGPPAMGREGRGGEGRARGGGSEASRDIVAENGEDSALVQKYGSSMETACSDMVCAPILVLPGVILSTSPFTTIHSLHH